MPTTTVADLKTAKRIKDVQIRLELSDDSDIRGLARQLETFQDEPLCNIVLVDAHVEHVRDWGSSEVIHLFEVIGNINKLVHLAFESLSSGQSDEDDDAPLSLFPVTLITSLLQKIAPRLESLVMESVMLTGPTPQSLDAFAESIESLRSLRSCIITSNFDLSLDQPELGGNPYPLDGVVTAISKLPLLMEADFVSYGWYEAGFPLQFGSSEPLKNLIQSPCLQDLTLGEFHLANEGLKDVGRTLEHNQSLRRLELHFAPSPTRTSMASLALLANALKVNTTLEIFKLEFDESCPKLDSFLTKIADALARNPRSALQKLKVTSPMTYGAGVEEAFCNTLQSSNYSLRRLEFVTILEDANGEEEEENYTCLDGSQRTEIDLYLRLNAKGRKNLIRSNGVSRAKWIQTFSQFTHDLDALHYYVRMNPWLCHDEEPPTPMDTTPIPSSDTSPEMLQGLHQLISAGFQSTQGEIQQLQKKMDVMSEQHAREKSQLEEEVKLLREEVMKLKVNGEKQVVG